MLKYIERFMRNENWKTYRFKKLKSGYPKFDFPEELIDEVDMKEFLKVDKHRIPLFIGSQFGVFPDPEVVLKNTIDSILVAKLGKSILSGHVSGLTICAFKEGKFNEIESFKN